METVALPVIRNEFSIDSCRWICFTEKWFHGIIILSVLISWNLFLIVRYVMGAKKRLPVGNDRWQLDNLCEAFLKKDDD